MTLKIAFIAQPFDVVPPIYNQSLAIWIDEIANRLVSDYEVTVYSRRNGRFPHKSTTKSIQHIRLPTLLDELISKGFKFIALVLKKLLKRDTLFFHKYYYFAWYYYIFYIIFASISLRQEKISVIILPNFSQFIPIIKLFNKQAKILIVMQCDWLIESNKKTIAKRLANVEAILGCSNYIAEGIKQRFPAYEAKTFTLYNGSNPQLFSKETGINEKSTILRETLALQDQKVILFVGRITPEKGVHTLIQAMKDVLSRFEDCVLLIIGGFYINPPSPALLNQPIPPEFQEFEQLKKDYESNLRSMAQLYGDKVRFLGEVAHSELAAYYHASDIFVHPSLWNEPFGMILTEAMYGACPIVSTYTGGIPEIVVHGETGLLVQPNDSSALAQAIIQLFENEEMREKMGQAGQQRVSQKFSWDQTAQTLRSILKKII